MAVVVSIWPDRGLAVEAPSTESILVMPSAMMRTSRGDSGVTPGEMVLVRDVFRVRGGDRLVRSLADDFLDRALNWRNKVRVVEERSVDGMALFLERSKSCESVLKEAVDQSRGCKGFSINRITLGGRRC